MEQIKGLDNQQVTELAYFAGLFDGEGSLMITRHFRKDFERHTYRGLVQFTNTDPILVNAYCKFLRDMAISYFVHTDDRTDKKRRVCYQVIITALDSQKRWLEVFIPFLRGKKDEAEILYDYVTRRLRRNAENLVSPRNRVDGRFLKGGRAAVDDYEISLFDKLRHLHSGTSETLRVPRENFYPSEREDKVQPQ